VLEGANLTLQVLLTAPLEDFADEAGAAAAWVQRQPELRQLPRLVALWLAGYPEIDPAHPDETLLENLPSPSYDQVSILELDTLPICSAVPEELCKPVALGGCYCCWSCTVLS
jgi:hypothetical protein